MTTNPIHPEQGNNEDQHSPRALPPDSAQNTIVALPNCPAPRHRRRTRKPRVLKDGSMRPLTRLKQMVLDNVELRDRLFALAEGKSSAEFIDQVNAEFGLDMPPYASAVTRFLDHVEHLRALEAQEDRMERIESWYQKRFPRETLEQLHARALLHFCRDALATGDREGYIRMARTGAVVKREHLRERMVDMHDSKLRRFEEVWDNEREEKARLEEQRLKGGGLSPEVIAQIERDLNLL